MVERLERRKEPVADRGGAGGGQLLAADDGAEAGETRLASPQREDAGFRRDGDEPRVLRDQSGEGGAQIVITVEEERHAISSSAKADDLGSTLW